MKCLIFILLIPEELLRWRGGGEGVTFLALVLLESLGGMVLPMVVSPLGAGLGGEEVMEVNPGGRFGTEVT